MTDKILLTVSFDAPENTTIELQGPALEAYYKWQEDGDDVSADELSDAIMDQCEDHVAMWTSLRDWDHAR